MSPRSSVSEPGAVAVPANARVSVLCASHSPLVIRDRAGLEGRTFRAGMDRAKAFVEAFRPDLVVYFAPDHLRALREVVPAFTVVRSATGYGDWEGPVGEYRIDPDLSARLALSLLDENFDVAVGDGLKLDHGFGQTWSQIFGPLDACPVLPIIVNCALPPLPSMSRTVALGRAVGRFGRSLGPKILYLGSGGLSHDPPLDRASAALPEAERRQRVVDALRRAAERVDPKWDAEFLRALERSDWAWIERMQQSEISRAGVGGNEIRTWVAAFGAAGLAASETVYEPVPEWITGMGIAMAAG